MLTVQVLVCAIAVLGGDCAPDNATDYWYAEPAKTTAGCLQSGQFSAAQYPKILLKEQYVKIRCLQQDD